VRNILDRHGIPPAPVHNGSIGWRHLMTHYKDQLLACDFFTIETIYLQTMYNSGGLPRAMKNELAISLP
jgi:hypothetical protein